jgi:hypothetical protein
MNFVQTGRHAIHLLYQASDDPVEQFACVPGLLSLTRDETMKNIMADMAEVCAALLPT